LDYVGLIGTLVGIVVGIIAVITFAMGRMDKNKHISEESGRFKAEFDYLRKGVSDLDAKMNSTNSSIQSMKDDLFRMRNLNAEAISEIEKISIKADRAHQRLDAIGAPTIEEALSYEKKNKRTAKKINKIKEIEND
jgi:uncharacterized membrane-anchored protein YhcB (DUF1043 family)